MLASLEIPAFLEMTAVIASELKDEPLCEIARSRLLPHRRLNLIWPQFCISWGPAPRYLALVT